MIAFVAAVTVTTTSVVSTAVTPAQAGVRHRGFDHPYAGFAPPITRLHAGSSKEAGLDTAEIDAMVEDLRGYLQPQGAGRPLFPGAVVLAAREGKVVLHEATGQAVKYADAAGTELPVDQQVPMAPDTIFDLASISKLFTSIVVMQQVEDGRVDLDATVASYLPEFASGGKETITVRQLLTHTSGLPSWIRLWRPYPDRAARIQAVLTVTPTAPPQTRYEYSDLNLITLGVLVERVSRKPLDVLVRDGVTRPLRMVDTGYNPPADKLDRIAATEFESDPARGMVRGSVHDENAWSLGGVAGHAGVFSTANDLAILAQTMLNGGAYDGRRIMAESTVTAMLTDFNAGFPGHAHGLGFELDQRFYMGALASPSTAGHTGFTGTSIVIDPLSRSVAILLTNRVHPRREWSSVNPARRAVTGRLAQALSVTPRRGRTAWYAGRQDSTTSTLTLPVSLRHERTRLGFELFVDTETTDILTLELSRDGGSTWSAQPFVVSSRGRISHHDGTISGFAGRHWQQAYAEIDEPPGQVQIRWRYVTDPLYQGRGVYVDEVRLGDAEGMLVDGERDSSRFLADGWTEAEH
ncbi:serine hydrolase [Actinopolymorpha pittospori]|uniref:CubicO group peptidase (Beta-lactamase class C family) n=1 Tax=Actinopolymorpha pittospori TaxID=648752 RepID=A0A927RK44_9ACTN|nr:CubicO group peptidase (beta-lactamase class C family) [Actinopolymorpha pittospori]